jgi:hypothetical protein
MFSLDTVILFAWLSVLIAGLTFLGPLLRNGWDP